MAYAKGLKITGKKFSVPFQKITRIDNSENDSPNELTMQVIEESERGENLNGPFNSVEEVMEALNAES